MPMPTKQKMTTKQRRDHLKTVWLRIFAIAVQGGTTLEQAAKAADWSLAEFEKRWEWADGIG